MRAEINEDGGSASAHPCDIRDEAAVGATSTRCSQQRGRLDGLVNNAGGQYRAPMKTISTKGFEAVVRNNLTGGFIFMREVYNRWMEGHGGAIVNIIADIWQRLARLRALGRGARRHADAERDGGLRMGGLGRARQRASRRAASHRAASTPTRPRQRPRSSKFAATVPLQRFGTEAEVSAAIVYLLSPAASYITGTCLRVDGGTPNTAQLLEDAGRHERSPAVRRLPSRSVTRTELLRSER